MWMHGKHSVQTMLVFMGKGHMSSHGADNTRVAGRRIHPTNVCVTLLSNTHASLPLVLSMWEIMRLITRSASRG